MHVPLPPQPSRMRQPGKPTYVPQTTAPAAAASGPVHAVGGPPGASWGPDGSGRWNDADERTCNALDFVCTYTVCFVRCPITEQTHTHTQTAHTPCSYTVYTVFGATCDHRVSCTIILFKTTSFPRSFCATSTYSPYCAVLMQCATLVRIKNNHSRLFTF